MRYDYTVGAAFRSIDRHHEGKVSTYNLGTFLRSVGHFAGEHELLAIVRRMDTDGNCFLNFSEFSDFMQAGPAAPVKLPLPPPMVPLPVPRGMPMLIPDPLLVPVPSFRYLSPIERVRIRAASPIRDLLSLPVRPRSVYRSPVRMPHPLAPVPVYMPSPRRVPSPVRAPLYVTHSPVRPLFAPPLVCRSPVRPLYAHPLVGHSPVRPLYAPPLVCHSPVRPLYAHPLLAHSPVRSLYAPPVLPVSPSHSSPHRKPILQLPEEDQLISSMK